MAARISACLIARDEETLLPGCLASVAPWVDEICLLDTGSTDRTCEIARAAGAHVRTQAWQDDFAFSRNASLSMASGDWILVIDADERIEADSGPCLRSAATLDGPLAYLVKRRESHEHGSSAWAALPRLFRNHPDIRFNRPVHESVMDSLFALGTTQLADSGVRLVHLGYRPEQVAAKDKHGRNLRILRKHFEAAPEDLYNSHKLALTLPEDAVDERRRVYADACARLWRLSPGRIAELPFVPRMLDGHAASLSAAGALSEAIAVAERGLRMYRDSAELQYRRGELARRAGDFASAQTFLLRALEPRAHSAIRFDRPEALAVRCHIAWLALQEDGAELPPPPDLLGPSSLALHCAQLRARANAGELEAAREAIAALIPRYGEHDEVKLLAGELAWQLGRCDEALAHFSSTRPTSEAGHRARTWLAFASATRGQVDGVVAITVRDLADAALAALFGSPDAPIQLDPAIDTDALVSWAARWQHERTRMPGRA